MYFKNYLNFEFSVWGTYDLSTHSLGGCYSFGHTHLTTAGDIFMFWIIWSSWHTLNNKHPFVLASSDCPEGK